MKLRYILPTMALLMPMCMFARPADNRVQTYVNPDGTTVEIINHGDENFHYYTDSKGVNVLEFNANGYIQPVVRQGRQLQAISSDLNLLREECGETISTTSSTKSSMKMAALDTSGRSSYTTTGTVHGLVVLLEYSDVPFTVPNIHDTMNNMLNQVGYSDYGATGSAADYYRACSNGIFNPVFDVVGPVKLPHTNDYYVATGESIYRAGTYGRFAEAIEYALKEIDPEVNFADYDLDNDGIIDNIYFFYSGYGQADAPAGYSNTIWPHQGNFEWHTTEYSEQVKSVYGVDNIGLEPLYLDGKKMATYACSMELNGKVPTGFSQPYLAGIGGFCHEYAHVLGLPDMYDTNGGKTNTPGYWTIMDQGSYNNYSRTPPMFNAYERWLCKWLEYTDAEANTSYTVGNLEDKNEAVRIRIPANASLSTYYPNEYYVVETRGAKSWDAYLPNEGMLIWHIRYNRNSWASNVVNCNNDPRISLVTPNSSDTPWPSSDGEISYIYPGSENGLTVSDYSSRYFKPYVTGMTYDEDNYVGSFDYNVISSQPDVKPIFNEFTRGETGRKLTMSWQPVENATGYYLTLYFMDGTSRRYVSGLNDKYVGNVTSYELASLPASYWTKELHATVRAVVGVPSSEVSDEMVFTPSDLSVSGVNDVFVAEGVIAAGNGYIIAPDGAEVYNLSGVKTGKENLPAGIYIVRYAGKSVKLMVK